MEKLIFRFKNPGIAIRMKRILNSASGRTVVVPMDHGVSVGPIDGIVDMKCAINKMANGGADAVVLHKGCVADGNREEGKDINLIIHLSSSTDMFDPLRKKITCKVEEATRLGADAVSMHINFANKYEHEMIEQLGEISEKCRYWGMPLMVMAYPRGPKIDAMKKKMDKEEFNKANNEMIAHCARVAYENSATIIKIPYTGDQKSFKKIVESCPVPILIAGGPKMDTNEELLQMVYDAIIAGAAGTSIGRNIFMDESPERKIKAISGIVHEGLSVRKALEILEG